MDVDHSSPPSPSEAPFGVIQPYNFGDNHSRLVSAL
jgi:hypothetical protein